MQVLVGNASAMLRRVLRKTRPVLRRTEASVQLEVKATTRNVGAQIGSSRHLIWICRCTKVRGQRGTDGIKVDKKVLSLRSLNRRPNTSPTTIDFGAVLDDVIDVGLTNW